MAARSSGRTAFLDRVRAALPGNRPGRRKVVFVLSGGGSLGAVQVGMLRALLEAEIRPDLILGCSVGAINGAGFATDPTLRGVARLDRIWRRLANGQPELMPSKLIPLAVQLARKGQSLHDSGRLEGLLSEELPVHQFEDLRVPFQCVATDLDAAREHWFSTGQLIPALMASAALPAVFPAVQLNGRTYIDGGVLTEVHAQRAVELGATDLYVLHVGHLSDRPSPAVQRPFDGALRAYWTARRFRLADDLAKVPTRCQVHLLPAGSTPRLRFDDFTRGPELAEIAYDQTRRYLLEVSGEDDPWAAIPIPIPVPGPLEADDPDQFELEEWPDRSTGLRRPGFSAPARPTATAAEATTDGWPRGRTDDDETGSETGGERAPVDEADLAGGDGDAATTGGPVADLPGDGATTVGAADGGGHGDLGLSAEFRPGAADPGPAEGRGTATGPGPVRHPRSGRGRSGRGRR